MSKNVKSYNYILIIVCNNLNLKNNLAPECNNLKLQEYTFRNKKNKEVKDVKCS